MQSPPRVQRGLYLEIRLGRSNFRPPVFQGRTYPKSARIVRALCTSLVAAVSRCLLLLLSISMIIGGVARIVSARRGTADQRVAAALSGLASIVFGILALS